MCIARSTPGSDSNMSGSSAALVADRADQRALDAARHVHVEARGPDALLDRLDRFPRGVGFHDDDHDDSPLCGAVGSFGRYETNRATRLGRPIL